MLIGYPGHEGSKSDVRAALDDMILRHARGLPVDLDDVFAAIEFLDVLRGQKREKVERLKKELEGAQNELSRLRVKNSDLTATVRTLTELAATKKEPTT